MLARRTCSCLLLACLVCLPACGGGVQERTYQIRPQPPAIDKVVELLKRYRDGVPPGSEMKSLQALILDLRNQSPDQAEIVDAAFMQLQENTQNAAAIAKETLRQLEIE
jgi:hypothetical protein